MPYSYHYVLVVLYVTLGRIYYVRANGKPLPWSYDEALSLLDDLDAISYTLCDIVDTAELIRQAHASEAFRRSASDTAAALLLDAGSPGLQNHDDEAFSQWYGDVFKSPTKDNSFPSE